jgi:hypothetical protein
MTYFGVNRPWRFVYLLWTKHYSVVPLRNLLNQRWDLGGANWHMTP